MKTAYITTSYICNQKCSFCPCTTAEKRTGEPKLSDLKEIARRLIEDNGIEHIVVSGGEPTLFSGFIDFMEYICKLKTKRVTVLSTSERFSDYTFLHEFATRVNLEKVDVISTIHSQNVSEHENINGLKGSFERTINGLLGLNRVGIKCTVKHCITKLNYKDLADFYCFVSSTFPEAVDVQFCSIDYCSIPKERLSDEMLSFPDLEPYFEEMFDIYLSHVENGSLRKLYCIYMPLCSADPYYWDYFSKNAGEYDSYVSISKESKYTNSSNQSVIGTFATECEQCTVKTICPGTYKSAFDAYGNLIVKAYEENDEQSI